MTLDHAILKSSEVKAALDPFCLAVQCVGPVRRMKPGEVRSVELVAVPDKDRLHALRDLVNSRWGRPKEGEFPSAHTKIRGISVLDIIWATADTFGMEVFVRTGSPRFVQDAMNHWKRVSGGGYHHEGRLRMADGTAVPTPTELDVFRELGSPFVKPELRNR